MYSVCCQQFTCSPNSWRARLQSNILPIGICSEPGGGAATQREIERGRKRKRENRKREKVATESGIEDKTLVYLLMGRLGS